MYINIWEVKFMKTLFHILIIDSSGSKNLVFIEAHSKEQAELQAYRENEPCEVKEVEELF